MSGIIRPELGFEEWRARRDAVLRGANPPSGPVHGHGDRAGLAGSPDHAAHDGAAGYGAGSGSDHHSRPAGRIDTVRGADAAGGAASVGTGAAGPAQLEAWLIGLESLVAAADGIDPAGTSPDRAIDAIAALERAKGSLGALQARLEVAFRESQIAAQKAAGIGRDRLGRGIADQIALARRISPKQASDELALRRVLVETMPRTQALLASGRINEWAAHEVARAVLVLDDGDRALVDAELEPELPDMTARRAGGAARARAAELDPESAVRRTRSAMADRHVSLRPAPDGMVRLGALLPLVQGVATYSALTREARARRSAGDARGTGQIMADTLVQRATGAVVPDATGVEVQLLMTDVTLLGGGDDTASIDGHPVPGRIARHLALGIPSTEAGSADVGSSGDKGGADALPGGALAAAGDLGAVRRYLRRLYTDPVTGELIAMDPRRRLFTGEVRRFILARDAGRCRGPWCDAPARHVDHARRHTDGGATDADNGTGQCERLNHVHEMPGWSVRRTADPDGRHAITLTTPTGHSYVSYAPALRKQPSAATDRAP